MSRTAAMRAAIRRVALRRDGTAPPTRESRFPLPHVAAGRLPLRTGLPLVPPRPPVRLVILIAVGLGGGFAAGLVAALLGAPRPGAAGR